MFTVVFNMVIDRPCFVICIFIESIVYLWVVFVFVLVVYLYSYFYLYLYLYAYVYLYLYLYLYDIESIVYLGVAEVEEQLAERAAEAD